MDAGSFPSWGHRIRAIDPRGGVRHAALMDPRPKQYSFDLSLPLLIFSSSGSLLFWWFKLRKWVLQSALSLSWTRKWLLEILFLENPMLKVSILSGCWWCFCEMGSVCNWDLWSWFASVVRFHWVLKVFFFYKGRDSISCPFFLAFWCFCEMGLFAVKVL